MDKFMIIALSTAGFAIAYHIWRTKRKNKKLVCFIGEDCDKVVKSEFSALLFDAPNEIIGMIYYAFLILGYGIMILLPLAGLMNYFPILTLAVFLAAIFSLYLILIQAFILKEWCEWCLASSLINFLIFLIVFKGAWAINF